MDVPRGSSWRLPFEWIARVPIRGEACTVRRVLTSSMRKAMTCIDLIVEMNRQGVEVEVKRRKGTGENAALERVPSERIYRGRRRYSSPYGTSVCSCATPRHCQVQPDHLGECSMTTLGPDLLLPLAVGDS